MASLNLGSLSHLRSTCPSNILSVKLRALFLSPRWCSKSRGVTRGLVWQTSYRVSVAEGRGAP